MKKIILVVAPVAAIPLTSAKNPLSAEDISKEVVSCANYGASMVHLHVRDKKGNLTEDLGIFSQTLDLIRKESDIIIQASTGGLSNLTLDERCIALNDSRVEVASLNMGSVNFDDNVYINTLPDIRYWAKRMKEKGVHPELEIFEGGMINNAKILAEEGLLNLPFSFAFCPGFRGALPVSSDVLFFLRNMLPEGAIWGVNHHEMQDFSLLITALGLGATFIRVGFEDGIYYAPGLIACSNAELVDKLASIIKSIGYEIASPREARGILGIRYL